MLVDKGKIEFKYIGAGRWNSSREGWGIGWFGILE